MPMGNLATAASDFALGQNVRYVCNRYRCRWRPNSAYRPGGYYGYGPSYYRPSYGPSYYGPSYLPSYYGSGPGGYGYALAEACTVADGGEAPAILAAGVPVALARGRAAVLCILASVRTPAQSWDLGAPAICGPLI